jgi:hypothetical protein
MTFKTLAFVGGSSLFGLVLAATAPVTPPGRTLHPNELWSVCGGETFEDRCCDTIQRCITDDVCDAEEEEACVEFDFGEENPQNSNLDGCNAGPEGTTCTEDDDDNICLLIWSCRWNPFMGGFCEKNQAIDTEPAPKSCDDDC